ncbi:hypothetical protein SDC9_98767 [bioreactor metagenome]|uniref:Uncharacterized protein n=1 Tax=bioreactor metagenome TaxID=1076179 RepID=A0A645AQY7_9ZZZZ
MADKHALDVLRIHVFRQVDASFPVHRHLPYLVGKAGRTGVDRCLSQMFSQGFHQALAVRGCCLNPHVDTSSFWV